ncbi:hypothetical protein J5N97_006943 [Dioscorea zingiberensis]|uniref:Transcription factor CBF/NF-Y/archaeal histone domain-containing protein n=1 Tax=Dioscorea zingiberensis TaxID=325984 RepID=A0A9D5DDN5_9LILI|nr:hypothetical protein J5N97_006943 [Dioscorea zingiberensis]
MKAGTGTPHQVIPSQSPLSDAEPPAKDAERFLPIANVCRIMKRSLPANAKISKEAKEAVQECVSEFINFITGEASDKCRREKRKTVNGEDLLWAMTTLGFENYVSPLKIYLNKYKESDDGEETKSSIAKHGEDSAAASERSFSGFDAGVYAVAPPVAPVEFMEFGVESMVGGGNGSGGGDPWPLSSLTHGAQWGKV